MNPLAVILKEKDKDGKHVTVTRKQGFLMVVKVPLDGIQINYEDGRKVLYPTASIKEIIYGEKKNGKKKG